MSKDSRDKLMISRRDFVSFCGLASATLFPAPLRPAPIALGRGVLSSADLSAVDYRLHPRYRVESPLDPVIRKVQPEFDIFPAEQYAEEIESMLRQWSLELRKNPRNLEIIGEKLANDFLGSSLRPSEEKRIRSDRGLEIFRRRFSLEAALSRQPFLEGLSSFFKEMGNLITAEFEIVGISAGIGPAPIIRTRVRYDLVGTGSNGFREERLGHWELQGERDAAGRLILHRWSASEETLSRAPDPAFIDVTSRALGSNSSYTAQLLRGVDHWRAVLDAASGIDVYGNNGIAVGDIDNDGFDELYVCQPAGLPNRLYRNRGDGTFEDATEAAGVGVLDSTACALFADFDNDGHQDLLVVRSAGPLLFLNAGNGRFRLQPEAFRFAQPPQGTFTGAAVADYDRDGWLDVYFCLYSYYQGLDQYRFPLPYHDAQNGPPNFLFRNRRDGTFEDVTFSTGMNRNNNRFSFACGWCDYNDDGWPDLYVANDFGRKNLYRNNGDGAFTDVAVELGVEDVGAGMSVCWFDYDHDGRQDLYVADMWSSAGLRITEQQIFKKEAPAGVRALYRKHARGNSLFHNDGNGRFSDRTPQSGVAMGRWAWSSDAWDFDHDGYADLYVANGFISAPDTHDLSSFFWRQVVSHSPLEARISRDYEKGWNAINELVRSGRSWNGYERNNFFVNNRDGTFSEAAGALGLDFPDDARAFALADFDHDGRLEIALKNRNAPQIRILRNVMEDIGSCIAFRLRGRKSNRDAIGAAVTIESERERQTKFLQAGSGFLSQHTKELFFGLGKIDGTVRARVRWPSGLTQRFEDLPANHRIEIEEGSTQFTAAPFGRRGRAAENLDAVAPARELPLINSAETWLIEPLPAPDFALPDLEGRAHRLSNLRGKAVLLNFWSVSSPQCQQELRLFDQKRSQWSAQGLHLVTVNVNDAGEGEKVRTFLRQNRLSLLVLLANPEVLGIFNIVGRYLFDARRDLRIPTSFLLNREGSILKVYQGPTNADHLENDLRSFPRSDDERAKKALPFGGQFYGGRFTRNHFTYGVAFFQRGYLNQALEAFQHVVRENPDYSEAHYNLGTLYFRTHKLAEARRHLERALELKPRYPDALNNLGLVAAETGETEDARRYFRQAIEQDASYAIALQNFGNLSRREGRLGEAQQMLEQATRLDPDDPEANYSLGMVFAQKGDTGKAREYFQKALLLRPDYPEALNNLGVLYLRTRRLDEAAESFQQCIRVSPDFDQPYLNLARLYAATGQTQKGREILRQLLERKPDHQLARQLLKER